MNDVVRTILIMSISGTVLGVLLILLKPILRYRIPKVTQYYLWVVVIIALLLPISLFASLLGNPQVSIPVVPNIRETVSYFVVTEAEVRARDTGEEIVSGEDVLEQGAEVDSEQGTEIVPGQDNEEVGSLRGLPLPNNQHRQTVIVFLSTLFIRVYPFGVLLFSIYFGINYIMFWRLYRRRNEPVKKEVRVLLISLCENRRVPALYCNPLVTSPMLFGFFRPTIILPKREYSRKQLTVIFTHELLHYRRRDTMVKGLTLLATVLHWFNPLVWFARKEIENACELACDEGVIQNLDREEKMQYGKTLIDMSANVRPPRMVTSVTMSEEKKNLKERLGSIMRSKAHSRISVIFSILLVVAGIGVAVLLGLNGSEGDHVWANENYNEVEGGPGEPEAESEGGTIGTEDELDISGDENGGNTSGVADESEGGASGAEDDNEGSLGIEDGNEGSTTGIENETEARPVPTQVAETIVLAGTFWEDWWSMEGLFAYRYWEWMYWEEIPEYIVETRGTGIARMLPSFSFQTMEDVRNYLRRYYTNTMVEAILGREHVFIEYDGVLYVDGTRAGFPRPDWNTATHRLVEQEGDRMVVETTVLWNVWHRGDEIGEPWEAQYRFIIIDGRIDAVEADDDAIWWLP